MNLSPKYETCAIENLPYVYLPGYASFCKKTGGGNMLFFTDEKENSMACRSWKNKFISLLQPLYPPLNKNGVRLSIEEEKKFLNTATVLIKDKKIADRISQSPTFAVFNATPTESVRVPFATYFLDLENNNVDELTKNLHSKHRNVIRNAEKNGIDITFGADRLSDFYSLYSQTMKRSNMHCEPISFFETFMHELSEQVICGVAYFNGKPQGALLMPHTNFGAFYLYGASAEKIEITGAMNYLHWQTILKLKQAGVKRYDFVGARLSTNLPEKLKGIQQFKERFGSKLEKGYLWKKDISPFKCKAYDKLLAVKLGLKGQEVPLDIITQEQENYGKLQ